MINYRTVARISQDDLARVSKAYENWGKVRNLMRIERILSNLKEVAEEREENRYTLQNYTEIKSKTCCRISKRNIPKAIFDLIAAIAYFLSTFTSSYYVFFFNTSGNQLPTTHSIVTETVIACDFLLKLTLFLSVEIYMNFSSFTTEKLYFSLSLIPELLALFPFYLLDESLVWFRLFRILTVNRLINWIEDSYLTKRLISEVLIKDEYLRKSLLGLARFTILVTITCHIIACIWYYITTVEDYPENWMQGKYNNNTEKFMASLYWTTVTFTSVGYGDITPKTIPEYIYTMIIQFLGIMFFAYLMGNVNTYIGNIDKKKNALVKRENDLDKWIFELDRNYPEKVMPDHIYKGIREFYKFQWENDDSSIENFNQFMLKLPTQLRHEMNIYIYKSRIEFLGAFMVGMPENCIYDLAAHMKPRFENRAVEIIKKDSKCKIFFVIKTGNVLVVDEEPFLRLYPRSYFGEICVLLKDKSDFAYITDGECTLFTIRQSAFQKVTKSDFRVLSLRAFRRNKYFHLVNQNLNKEELNEELATQIEDFNVFSEDVVEDEMQEFEVKLTKLAPSQGKDEKYLRKIKELQDSQFEKMQKLQEEVESIKAKLD